MTFILLFVGQLAAFQTKSTCTPSNPATASADPLPCDQALSSSASLNGSYCRPRSSSRRSLYLLNVLHVVHADLLASDSYAAMAAYHLYNYLRVQDHRLGMQSSLLRTAYALLRFTRWITFPQKVVPAAFALAWLGKSALSSVVCTSWRN